ncbi:MAG TPA: hypothetical protein VFV66_32200 [Nonomuraea sp.]|nr:hypothetical protein [Nonomuraea sp.]
MRVPAFLVVLLAAACAAPPAPLQEAQGPRAVSPEGQVNLSASGEFTDDDTAAIAYDRKLVPKGAQASVTVESAGGTTRTSLIVEGLLPNRRYGAHLHTKPCGRQPEDSGSHYQHHPGQVNPSSEVWLDFTTDGEGAGRSSSRNAWMLDPDRLPGALVIHASPTVTSGPKIGDAGARMACLTLR